MALTKATKERISKERLLTENGLTVSQEEEILAIKEEDLSEAMTPGEFLGELQSMIDQDEQPQED